MTESTTLNSAASAPADAALAAEDARVSSREALRFLTRAGRALAGSLDYDETLRRVVKFAIPRVACFAAIDLLRPDGRLERRAFGHIDPAKQALLEAPEPFLPRAAGYLPIAAVLEEGRALLIEKVAQLDAVDGSGEADIVLMQRLRQLGGQSVIVVPLSARQERIGVIAFGSTRTDRFYGPADLALAQELARTAGLAIDNARLFRDAEHAIRARDEVLSVVSHDLRNPVHRVSLAAELLLDGDQVAAAARSTVAIIRRAADEMDHLIRDLLDVSRIETGTLTLSTGPVDVGQLLVQLEEEFRPLAEKHGVDWSAEIPEGAPTIEIDDHRVRQALGNLIGNAFKFTPRDGSVRLVCAQLPDRAIEIAVRDTGPGMTAEQRAHVFDRFWQAEPGDRRGAGVGLSIARGIADAHGGDLRVESEPGAGSVFTLRLPARPADR
ncbi:MAG: sensor histidine kinase [Longimicrobiales bacterium]